MAVTETLRALGGWGLTVRPTIPDELWNKIDYFSHVCIHVGQRVDPRVAGDSLLKSSRYTGVVRAISEKGDSRTIGGSGMAMWLGDADNKGDTIESLLTFTAETFANVIRALLPASGAVTEGTLFTLPSNTYSGTFQFQSPREAIDYLCQTKNAAWRVNGDATLDAGLESDLFVVNPKVVVLRKQGAQTVSSFDDMFLRALGGSLETARDVEDLTTRVLLMAQGSNGEFASATADAAPGVIPYVDLHGNNIKLTRIVQESETDDTNAVARAQLQLNRFLGTRDALTLSSANYDFNGDAHVGDYVYVYDPQIDLMDPANEILFRAQRMNPLKLQLTETSWPVVDGMSVFYRGQDGGWIDLTEYVVPENGDTTLVVGGYNRSLSDGGGGAFPVTPPETNTTVPGVPTWVTPFGGAVYQSPLSGETRAQAQLKWTNPNNTDSSPITDGDHWEIRYRTATAPLYPITHAQMAVYTHTQLAAMGTFAQPITYAQTEWETAYVPWGQLEYRLTELTPNMPYEAQIRAVDNGRPANIGAWSTLASWQAAKDTLPPTTPAAPDVAASLISVQVTHQLGKSTGGTFNLEPDLHHLEVHAQTEPLFEPTPETLLGKLMASWGMITGQIPVVGTFPIKETAAVYVKVVAVDETGNKSLPSPAASSTAELIDSLHVSEVSVSKLTAGVLTADFINAASIKTGETGARVELSYRGVQGYKADNTKALDWRSDSGLLEVIGDAGIRVTGGGNVEIVDGAVIIKNSNGDVIVEMGECADGRHGLQVYRDTGVRVARIGELASTGGEGIELINDLGQLVRVNTLAFGTEAASVSALASTTSTTFGDLPGSAGPFVTATVGNSGRAIVILGSWMVNPSNAQGTASLAINTATGGVILADNIKGVSGPTNNSTSASRAFFVTGLPAGSTDFLMKYRTNTGGVSVSFLDRHMVVIPY